MKNTYLVKSDHISMRLDRWIKKTISNVPQSLIEKNIRKGNIKINNKRKKSSYKLKKNDEVILYNFNFSGQLHKKKSSIYEPTKKDLSFSTSIFIEDNENFSVINKPAGIAVQYGTKSRKNIIDLLRHTKEFASCVPYTVHRIDKDTSGILLVAKNRNYAQLFTSLFRIRKIKKIYLALVLGEIYPKKGKLEDILTHYEGNKKISSKAITYYEVLDSNFNFSLLKLIPFTGRKHQLRKQLFMKGNPILGDKKYQISNNYTTKNLMLHAHKIEFSIKEIKYNFTARPSKEFEKGVKKKYLKNVGI